MPARAYYIPASKRMDNLVEHREESDRMQLLNGTWKFQYLDVYKRQIKGLTKGKRYFVRITTYKTVMADGKPKDIIAGWGYDCLLYTSRCV